MLTVNLFLFFLRYADPLGEGPHSFTKKHTSSRY
jgi:hypothetical protein